MDKGMCSREVIIENYRKCPRGSKFNSECLCSLWDELTIIISFTLAPCFLASRVNYPRSQRIYPNCGGVQRAEAQHR